MALAPTDVAGIEEITAIHLVTAHRCGDRDAFAEIVRSHYSSLLATAYHRLRNAEDAKDAVQETLLRALLALDRFGDTGDWRLGAWLNTILIHVCADIPARRHPTTPLDEWVLETVPYGTEETSSDPVALAAVKRAIDELPESQRRAFQLRLVDGLSYGEVAGTLGISEVNARARVKRARAALRQTLSGSKAVSGAWAAVPLFLTAPLRAALRRVFAGWGHSARTASSQIVASGTASATSSAASSIAGSPGIQLATQVSSTPLGQAFVASATAAPAKGSVVLGIVASLATAGGLSAPAVISGSTAAPAKPASVAAAPATATLDAASTVASPSAAAPPAAAPTPSTSSVNHGGTSPATVPPPLHLVPPSWMTPAASAAAYQATAATPPPSPSSSGSTSTSGGAVTVPTSGAAPSGGTSSSAPSGTGTGAGASSAGSTSTGTPSPSPAPNSSPVVALPVGTCTGVTGFPGVTAPATIPALSSSVIDAILSTGALSVSTESGSPAFAGGGVMQGNSANGTAPVQVRVGTCLADGGSILAVDMTGSTGDQVQLVGSLVAKPFVTTTGTDAYLFRGNVTQLQGTVAPGGGLPWGLPSGFVAEVKIQPKATAGTLTVVFLQPQTQAAGGAGATSAGSTAPAPVASGTDPTGTATPPAATSGSGTSSGTVSSGSTSTP